MCYCCYFYYCLNPNKHRHHHYHRRHRPRLGRGRTGSSWCPEQYGNIRSAWIRIDESKLPLRRRIQQRLALCRTGAFLVAAASWVRRASPILHARIEPQWFGASAARFRGAPNEARKKIFVRSRAFRDVEQRKVVELLCHIKRRFWMDP